MNLDEFEKHVIEALKYIPAEFHKPIKEIAWNSDQSHEFHKVLNEIKNMANALEMPIQAYQYRIIKEEQSPF